MHLTPDQIAYGIAAAVLVGISKTGLPGAGILVVPMLAMVFAGRLAVGTMLPMLVFGDIFAVTWYRRHTQWDRLWGLFPWVVVGFIVGAGLLFYTGTTNAKSDILDPIIGAIVLAMLALHVARRFLGNRLLPTSPAGVAFTGSSAGFTTMVSNAAGPVMAIYLTAMRLPKEEFIGTQAWFFFIVNASKVPVFWALSALHPGKPMVTRATLLFDLAVLPAILLGVFLGKWLLYRVPQKTFDSVVLVLAGAAAAKLVYPNEAFTRVVFAVAACAVLWTLVEWARQARRPQPEAAD